MLPQTSITFTVSHLHTSTQSSPPHFPFRLPVSPRLSRDLPKSCPTAEHYTPAVLTTGSAVCVGPSVKGQVLSSGAHWLVGQASITSPFVETHLPYRLTSPHSTHTHSSTHTHIEQPSNTPHHTRPSKPSVPDLLRVSPWPFVLFHRGFPLVLPRTCLTWLFRSCHVAITKQ